MKITIKCKPKEIADLALELQNRLNDVVCASLLASAKAGDEIYLEVIKALYHGSQDCE